MKTKKQLLTRKKTMWNIVTENGIILATYYGKTCAQQNLSRYKISKHEILRVVET